jgi:hypothetical protein
MEFVAVGDTGAGVTMTGSGVGPAAGRGGRRLAVAVKIGRVNVGEGKGGYLGRSVG